MARRALAGEPAPDFLKACLLLLLAEQPSHGYELLDALRQLGLDPDPGNVYRRLRTMESQGLVRSAWGESEIGLARRTYRVTRKGESWLEDWWETARGRLRLLRAWIRRYEKLYV